MTEISVKTEQELDDVVKSNDFTMIRFSAQWCNPCKMLNETMEQNVLTSDEIDSSKIAFVKIDVDTPELQTSVVPKFDVRSIPYVVFVDKQGTKIEGLSFVGYRTPEDILEIIKGLYS